MKNHTGAIEFLLDELVEKLERYSAATPFTKLKLETVTCRATIYVMDKLEDGGEGYEISITKAEIGERQT